MSVINQMLRDLDKQREAGNPAAQARSLTPVVSTKRWLWLLILVLVLIIIIQQLVLPKVTSPSPQAQFPDSSQNSEDQQAAKPSLANGSGVFDESTDNATRTTQNTLNQNVLDQNAFNQNTRNQSLSNQSSERENPSILNGSDQGLAKKSEPAAVQAAPAQSKSEDTLVGNKGNTTVDDKSPIDETRTHDTHLDVARITPSRTAESTAETTAASTEATSHLTTPETEMFVAADNTLLVTNNVANADQAEAMGEPVLTITHDEPKANSATSEMAVQRVSPEQQLQLWQQQAEQALAEGRYQQAELLLRQVRALDPQLALPQLAELFWQQQQLVQFDAVVADAESLALTDVRLQRLVLYRLQQQQRWLELLVAINVPLETSYAVEVIALKAQALWQTAQYQPALLAYQQWAALAPNEARAWLGQGLAQEQLAQPKAARVAYQQALQRGGLSPASLQFIQQRLLAIPE